jgi:hypothetical protein
VSTHPHRKINLQLRSLAASSFETYSFMSGDTESEKSIIDP